MECDRHVRFVPKADIALRQSELARRNPQQSPLNRHYRHKKNVAWACTEETLVQLPEPKRQYFRMGYYALAIIMIVTPAAVIVMTRIFGIYDKWIFIVETVGIVMFAAYWGLKSYELSMSKAEEKAMKGEALPRPEEKRSLRMTAARLLD